MRLAIEMIAAAILLGLAAQGRTQRPSPSAKSQDAATVGRDAGAESGLEKAFAASGNDQSALVRNLQQYLLEFPNAPRKPEVYRALVEACQRLHNDPCALNYAERLVAIQPDDSDMMMIAVTYLQRKGDDESLQRAAGYVTRVLDRVEKSLPDERPRGEDLAAWQTRQENLRGVLYYLRGTIEYSRQDYDSATKDLTTSYAIRPSGSSAQILGGIAEIKGDPAKAIKEYALAFVLPDGIAGEKVDRHEIRERLGNLWRAVHGSEHGLGDAILAAYDQVTSTSAPSAADTNAGVKDALAFVAHRADGTPMALSTLKGKVVVLILWANWCIPCMQLQPALNDVASAWSGEARVTFLAANTEASGAALLDSNLRQKWDVPVIYAEGLDRVLNVRALPAVVVLGPDGEVMYHAEQPPLKGFAAAVSGAIQQAVGPAH